MTISDEKLMAYADGELPPDEAAEVERAIAEDEALAAKVAVFADVRREVKRALDAAPDVPDALVAKVRALAEADRAIHRAGIEPGKVIDLASRRRTVPLWQLPAAAAVALAIGIASGWFARPGGETADGLAVAGLSDPAIAEALETVAAGARIDLGGGAEFAAIATFRDGEGQLCREFEHDREDGATVVAVACRGETAWDVRFAVAAAAEGDQGYAPASSLETLDAYLSAMGAGAPLSDKEERTALDALR